MSSIKYNLNQNDLMTHSELVGEFHQTFDHPLKTVQYTNFLITPDIEPLVKFRISLINEEIKELKEAYDNNDFIEFVDALCDIVYVTYGAAHCMGYKLCNIKELDKKSIVRYTQKDTPLTDNKELIDKMINKLINIEAEMHKYIENEISKHNETFTWQLNNILYMVYNLSAILQIDFDKLFREVHRSNMSKVCTNIDDAKLSVEFYKTDERYKSPDYRIKGNYYVIYDKETSKILKNHKWSTPTLTNFL